MYSNVYILKIFNVLTMNLLYNLFLVCLQDLYCLKIIEIIFTLTFSGKEAKKSEKFTLFVYTHFTE